MEKSTKRKVAAGAAAAVAIAGGGVAIGATQLGTPQQESQAVVNDAAKQLGIDPAKLSSALEKAFEDRVDAAVAAGTITKDEGDALKAQIESGSLPLFFGGGHGFGFKPFPGGGPGLLGRADDDFSAAATYLGLTEAQLKTQLAGGKSLADVAKAQNKSVDGLVQALYDAQKKNLDAAVKAGKLTQAQEDQILSNAKSRLTDLVNGTLPPKLGFGFGLGHPGGADLSTAATYLGLTEAQLQAQLQNGKSLADVAKAQNKSVDGLVQALYDAQKKNLDAAVKAGKLTQAQEDQILANTKSRLTDLVNGTLPRFDRGGDGAMPGFGFRRFRGFSGPSPAPSGFQTA